MIKKNKVLKIFILDLKFYILQKLFSKIFEKLSLKLQEAFLKSFIAYKAITI